MWLSSVEIQVCYVATFSRKKRCAMLLSYVEIEVFLLLSAVESKVCRVAFFSRQQCVLICCLQQTAEDVMLLFLVESKVPCCHLYKKALICCSINSREYIETNDTSLSSIESKLCYCYLNEKTKYMLLSSVGFKVCSINVTIFSRQQSVLICYLQQAAECDMSLSLVESKVCYVVIFSSKQNVICCYLQLKAKCAMLLSSEEEKVCCIAIICRSEVCFVVIFSKMQSIVCCYHQQETKCVMLLSLVEFKVCYCDLQKKTKCVKLLSSVEKKVWYIVVLFKK